MNSLQQLSPISPVNDSSIVPSVDKTDDTGRMRYRVKSNSYLLYFAQLIIFTLIVLYSGVSNQGHSVLLLFTILYWAVVTMPILFASMGWINPLIFQMFFEIPKALSLACRATGHIDICKKWIVPIPYDSAVSVYIKCCIITCVGLLIEYCIMYAVTIKAKEVRIDLKKNRKPLILIVIAGFAMIMLMQGLGGIMNVLNSYQSRLTEFSEDRNLYYRYLIYWGTIPCMYFFLMEDKQMFILSLLANVFFFFAIGERGGLIISLGVSLVVVAILKREKSIRLSRFILSIIVFIFVYEKMGSLRDNKEISMDDFFDLKIEESASKFVDAMGNIQHFVISSEVVFNVDNGYIPHVYGKPLFNILVAPLPRKLFPWKPTYIADSALVGSFLLDRDTNVFGLPPGVFAYGYLNFGWIGVILFSIICGLFMKWLYVVLVLKYHELGQSIPYGNIILYTLTVNSAYTIISTEAQIKLIMYLTGFLILFILTRSKGEQENE